MLLLCFLLYLLFLFCFNLPRQQQRVYRKATVTACFKNRKKPAWVINKIIYFKAMMPNAGCRTLATTFNRQFGDRESVSKTWVCNTVRKYQYEIAHQRRKIKSKKPVLVDINRIWGMDMTGKHDEGGNNQQILGIIDHGSRFNLCLETVRSKASIKLLQILLETIEKYGKPESIRTDNEAVFTSKLFRFGLWLIGVKHQRTDVGCPWMNGRIERFFGTLKEKLDQVMVSDASHLNWHLKEFSFWYTYVRTHQNIENRTPNEVWSGKGFKRQARFYSGWDGILTGYYHPPDG